MVSSRTARLTGDRLPASSDVATESDSTRPLTARQKAKVGDKSTQLDSSVDIFASSSSSREASAEPAAEQDMQEREEESEEPEDTTLYCICLGYDNGTPMIQCEKCEQWFHLDCMGITEQEADNLDVYVCDLCAGTVTDTKKNLSTKPSSGKNKRNKPKQTFHSNDEELNSPPSSPEPDPASDQDFDAQDDSGRRSVRKRKKVDRGNDEFLGDAAMSALGESQSARKRPNSKSSGAKRSNRNESQAETAEMADSESDQEAPKRVKLTKRTSRTDSTAPAVFNPEDVTAVPATDKTRTACRNQLLTSFQSIFSVSMTSTANTQEGDEDAIDPHTRANLFAEEVETLLFESLAEIDVKTLLRVPRGTYLTKFRSLQFNLKSNAFFRSKISSSELTPSEIVNMSQQDLLTPELRAMAESVRAASLKNSVKQVVAAPTAKRTHKGEEEIENLAATDVAQEEASAQRESKEARQRENSFSERESEQKDAETPEMEQNEPNSFFGSPEVSLEPETERTSASPFTPSTNKMENLVDFEQSDQMKIDENSRTPELDRNNSDYANPSNSMQPPPRPSVRAKSSFDMASVFGRIKASPQQETSPQAKAEAEGNEPNDENSADQTPQGATSNQSEEPQPSILDSYDPFAKKTPKPSKETKIVQNDTPAKIIPIADMKSIWTGDLIVPDQGGFPAEVVQVGGRYLGTSTQTWSRLLPRKKFSMSGRIPRESAIKYLLECCFAPSREIVVLVVKPDLSGPSAEQPKKPSRESCLTKFNHVIDFYVKRERIGVITPSSEMKKLVKDIYFVPLKQQEPIPEFVQVLDEHHFTEQRQQDFLLAVLVLAKGIIPTATRSPQNSPPPMENSVSAGPSEENLTASTSQVTPSIETASTATESSIPAPAAAAPAVHPLTPVFRPPPGFQFPPGFPPVQTPLSPQPLPPATSQPPIAASAALPGLDNATLSALLGSLSADPNFLSSLAQFQPPSAPTLPAAYSEPPREMPQDNSVPLIRRSKREWGPPVSELNRVEQNFENNETPREARRVRFSPELTRNESRQPAYQRESPPRYSHQPDFHPAPPSASASEGGGGGGGKIAIHPSRLALLEGNSQQQQPPPHAPRSHSPPESRDRFHPRGAPRGSRGGFGGSGRGRGGGFEAPSRSRGWAARGARF